jgi:uncharacterized damage-inducible protein DinB
MLNRNEYLIEANAGLLLQGLNLLSGMDNESYRRPIPEVFGSAIGGHMRHVLEFYECFFDGIGGGQIDYDGRRRDRRIETSRTFAMHRIESYLGAFRTDGRLTGAVRLRVRMEDAPESLGSDAWLESSVSREMQVLLSHTTHHYALIAVGVRLLGLDVPAHFGVAPSTIRYQAQRREAA